MSNHYTALRGHIGWGLSFLKAVRNRFLNVPPLEPMVRGEDIFAYIDRTEIARLSNPAQFFEGKNHWGAPPLSQIRKDGKFIGWAGRTLVHDGLEIPCLQPETDLLNWERALNRFRPDKVVECGTAYGGSAVLFLELSRKLGIDLRILTIDIDGTAYDRFSRFHDRYGTSSRVKRVIASATSPEARNAVQEFLKPEDRVLFHFDDLHSGEHVLMEIKAYKQFLTKVDDVFIVGDTWDHGFYGPLRQPGGSPYTAVVRFLNSNPDIYLDYGFHRELAMPCNFIEGVLRRRLPPA